MRLFRRRTDSETSGLTGVHDAADLTWVLSAVSEVPGIERWIPGAIADEPDSALPLLLSGARQIAWAWEARTRAQAKYVSQEQWKTFGERLEVAEEQLYEAAERERTSAASSPTRTRSARGVARAPRAWKTDAKPKQTVATSAVVSLSSFIPHALCG